LRRDPAESADEIYKNPAIDSTQGFGSRLRRQGLAQGFGSGFGARAG
jgi:hypothetical protein